METDSKNQQRIFHKILTYGAALILCSVVALIVLQLIGSSTGRDVNNENIVLTFIGILATFIVVGNFTQVDSIKKDLKIDIDNLSTRVHKIEETHVSAEKLSSCVEDQNSAISSQVKDLFTIALVFSNTNLASILFSILKKPNEKYHIENAAHETFDDVIAKIVDSKIEFYKTDEANIEQQITDVTMVNNIPFNYKLVNEALEVYYQSLNNPMKQSPSDREGLDGTDMRDH